MRVRVLGDGTFTGAFVGLQLHEVWAGAGKGLVEVDKTQMGAGFLPIDRSTRVGS